MPAGAKSRARTKPAVERRGDLMDAAQQLFLKQGVGSTTVEQITDRAGTAKGTFYLYFSSKQDVLAALGDQYGEGLLAGIRGAIDAKRPQDWSGKLAAWARASVAGYLDSIRLHDVLFHASGPPTREGLTDNVIVDHLETLLRAGASAQAWQAEDPRFTAVFLFGGLHSVVDHAHAGGKKLDRDRLARRLERICFRAVGLRPQ